MSFSSTGFLFCVEPDYDPNFVNLCDNWDTSNSHAAFCKSVQFCAQWLCESKSIRDSINKGNACAIQGERLHIFHCHNATF